MFSVLNKKIFEKYFINYSINETVISIIVLHVTFLLGTF